mgnify:CR=1 FL=1
MKLKKIPLRTCVVSGEKLEKRQLLRIVKNKDNEVKVDETGKMNGRGAYIKKDMAILEQAIAKNTLGRKLECQIPPEIYDEIKEIINKQ